MFAEIPRRFSDSRTRVRVSSSSSTRRTFGIGTSVATKHTTSRGPWRSRTRAPAAGPERRTARVTAQYGRAARPVCDAVARKSPRRGDPQVEVAGVAAGGRRAEEFPPRRRDPPPAIALLDHHDVGARVDAADRVFALRLRRD